MCWCDSVRGDQTPLGARETGLDARRVLRTAGVGALFLLSGAAPGQGAKPPLTALGVIAHGEFALRESGDAGAQPRKLCLSDPSVLLQLRHGNAQCSQFVVENSADTTTVHYTCAGHGYGRTTVSVETPRLFHVQSQGVFDGMPFVLDMEGRRVGDCAPR